MTEAPTEPQSSPAAVHYRLRHETRYEYADRVELGSHLLHLTPRALPGQIVSNAEIQTVPAPAHIRSRQDHFGNTAHFLFFDWPHKALEVVLTADITVFPPQYPTAAATPPWEQVRDRAPWSADAGDFLYASPMISQQRDATAYVAESFPAGRAIGEGLIDLTHRMRRDFTFRPGATNLHTQIADVLAQLSGVCQDFTHLMIAGLRGLGLPARYVSGYIRNEKTSEQVELLGADHSHAWVECWLGAEHGWAGVDPTNGVQAGTDHVILGWGRDYCDISPVRGIILGGGQHRLSVQVDLITQNSSVI